MVFDSAVTLDESNLNFYVKDFFLSISLLKP